MSDSFADLWNTTAPTSKPAPKLGSIATNATRNGTNSRPKTDVFSLLATPSPLHSNANSRSITPAMSSKSAGSSRTGEDAFSGLFGTSDVKKAESMTIAERAAQAKIQQQQQYLSSKVVTDSKPTSAWDGLDFLGSSVTSTTPAVSSNSNALDDDDDWGFGSSAIPSPPNPVKEDSLSSFTSSPGPELSKKPNSLGIWDLNEFAGPSTSTRPDSPSEDFDFGHRERLLDDDEDDILGELSKLPPSKSPSPPVTSRSRASKSSSRSTSPPPHILGQLIEMGFSIIEARQALASTDSGVDVQAAAEILLSASTASPSPPRNVPSPAPVRHVQDHTRYNGDIRNSTRNSPSPATTSQQTAQELLNQASEIGLNLFNKANSLWKESKEKVQKVYEERANSTSERDRPNDGRPKWMTQDGGFHDDEEHPVPAKSPPRLPSEQSSTPRPPLQSEIDLLAPAPESVGPQAYVSPFRRARSKPQSSTPIAPVASSSSHLKYVPKRAHIVVPASSSAIQTAKAYKSSGTESFKLGQYAVAETAYSKAIDALPAGHLLLIHLYNNRALARIKNGDFKAAERDVVEVLTIVGDDTTTEVIDGERIDFGDALLKAWKRRAEALEGRERWEDAGKDWERVAGAAWASSSIRSEGVRGAGRCRRMVHGDNAPQSAQTMPKKPIPPRRPVVSSKPAVPSAALKALREAEAESDAKFELKDTVEGKLLAWKKGKEKNIRGLLASLELVLWPELDMPKWNMSELISDGQVKIKYMKAIAKVHPDKLNTGNTTLEQRMLANGVFGTLNEAWNAFKQ